MDVLLVLVIVLAVLMGLVGLGVVAGSGRTRRMEERRIHADELRRESDFNDARAERARLEAEESAERGRRFERRSEQNDTEEESSEHLQGPRD
jgi:biopolymer transport protein ExbB/TolQ